MNKNVSEFYLFIDINLEKIIKKVIILKIVKVNFRARLALLSTRASLRTMMCVYTQIH